MFLNDYYAFGAPMPGRNFNANQYRYGFVGQNKDDEVSGVGNHIEFKHRNYDPRLGRFWSVDPLASKFAWNSPFAYAENRVIEGIDAEGLEFSRTISYNIATGQFNVGLNVKVKVTTDDDLNARTKDVFGVDHSR